MTPLKKKLAKVLKVKMFKTGKGFCQECDYDGLCHSSCVKGLQGDSKTTEEAKPVSVQEEPKEAASSPSEKVSEETGEVVDNEEKKEEEPAPKKTRTRRSRKKSTPKPEQKSDPAPKKVTPPEPDSKPVSENSAPEPEKSSE